VTHGIGGYAGAIVGFLLLAAAAGAIYLQSRKSKVDHNNVNAEWKGDLTAGLDEHGKPGIAGSPFTDGEAAPQSAEAKKASTQ
jgi:PiT family inorganic phosphate transporter